MYTRKILRITSQQKGLTHVGGTVALPGELLRQLTIPPFYPTLVATVVEPLEAMGKGKIRREAVHVRFFSAKGFSIPTNYCD